MKLKPSLSAAQNARTVLPKLARAYFKAGRKAIDGRVPAEKLHKFRLATKRFRYSLELFQPLYGPSMTRYLKLLRELQSALGDISDLQSIQVVMADHAAVKRAAARLVKGKVKDLRRVWRAFDAEGASERWRAYLAGDKPATRTARKSAAAN